MMKTTKPNDSPKPVPTREGNTSANPLQMLAKEQAQQAFNPLQLLADKKQATAQKKSTPINNTPVVQRIMWYMSDDHASAIKLLATENPRGFLWNRHNEASGAFGSSPLNNDTDSSVTLWGHTNGDASKFGGKTPEELVDSLITSRLDASAHTLLNIISCGPNMTFSKDVATYAQAVKELLGGKIGRKIAVKTLPMVEEGKESLLYRFELDKKIVYVRFPTGKENDVYTSARVYEGDSTKIVESWKRKGFDPLEMTFANVLSNLVETVKIQTHKGGEDDSAELLIPNVYGEE